MRVTHGVTIKRPIAAVFAALTHIEQWPAWAEAMREARQTSPGTLGVSATFERTFAAAGQAAALTCEIIAYEPPHTLAYRAIAGPLSLTCAYTLEVTADGTALAVEMEADGNSAAGAGLATAVAAVAGRDLAALAALLKSTIVASDGANAGDTAAIQEPSSIGVDRWRPRCGQPR